MFSESVTVTAAWLAGLLSFFSPCVLPLIPSYFSFITGLNLDQLSQVADTGLRRRVISMTVAYVLGFSLVFILLGASATLLGNFFTAYKDWLRIAGGLLIIVLGLHLLGILHIGWLEMDKRIHSRRAPVHMLGVFLVGMAFGAGWSPCIGPMLGSILIMAGNQDTVWQGMGLLGVFSLGLALPFLTLSFFIDFLLKFIRKAVRFTGYIHKIAGGMLVAMGALLLADKLYLLAF